MTDYAGICEKTEHLRKVYGTSDPYGICEQMDITVMRRPMGSGSDDCKGFFVYYCRIPLIMLNSDLSEEMQRIICAHELGHAVLHRKYSDVYQFQDVSLFNAADDMEKEANIFAAELLLTDDEVNETLNSDRTFFEAAASLFVPVEILDFKFRAMKWKGYKLVDAPTEAVSDFLKDMKDGGARYD